MVLVITLLDVETMWLNSPKTFHPHFLTTKPDSITTVTKGFYAQHTHIRYRMIGKVEVIPNRGVHFAGFDSGPMAIDAFFEGVFGLTNILNITNFTRDEVYDVGGSASNGAIGRVGSVNMC